MQIDDESQKQSLHPGNVWGFIVSLKREDAERVGYNSAEQWVNLLRSRRNIIAKEMGIAPSNLRWVAAYHNKETNPHVHMMVWSSRPQEPYLSREGIHNIKKTLASDIYRQEHIQIYKKQTDARDRSLELASYLVYKGYRDGKFTEKPSDKLRYLRMAVDAGFGYAEYEYAKYLMDKSPDDAKEYLRRAASHGSFQAEYTYGKMLFDEGKREDAKEWFERSARTDAWTQTRVGLLLYYEYEDHEAGKAFLSSAAEKGYEPAREVLRSIEQGLNARIIIGVCDLFYYAGNILDERSEDMYSQEHTIDYHGIDKKQRREDQAKRQGIIMY